MGDILPRYIDAYNASLGDRDGPISKVPLFARCETTNRAILECCELQMPLNLICDAVGVSIHDYNTWLNAAMMGDPLHVQFIGEMRKARAMGIRDSVRSIRDHTNRLGEQDWRARAWLLERSHRAYVARQPGDADINTRDPYAVLEELKHAQERVIRYIEEHDVRKQIVGDTTTEDKRDEFTDTQLGDELE